MLTVVLYIQVHILADWYKNKRSKQRQHYQGITNEKCTMGGQGGLFDLVGGTSADVVEVDGQIWNAVRLARLVPRRPPPNLTNDTSAEISEVGGQVWNTARLEKLVGRNGFRPDFNDPIVQRHILSGHTFKKAFITPIINSSSEECIMFLCSR